MGFRHAAILSATSFFLGGMLFPIILLVLGLNSTIGTCLFALGVLFISFNVDRRILYSGGPPSEEDYADAFKYYTTFFEAPLAIKALIHAVMGIGLLSIVGKLHVWDESAIWFDGSSMALFVAGIVIYLSVTVPTLRTIVTPHPEDTIQDQREAVAVLAAGNTLIAACLIGLLGLQGGQEYARRSEIREAKKLQAEEAAKAKTSASEKKDQ